MRYPTSFLQASIWEYRLIWLRFHIWCSNSWEWLRPGFCTQLCVHCRFGTSHRSMTWTHKERFRKPFRARRVSLVYKTDLHHTAKPQSAQTATIICQKLQHPNVNIFRSCPFNKLFFVWILIEAVLYEFWKKLFCVKQKQTPTESSRVKQPHMLATHVHEGSNSGAALKTCKGLSNFSVAFMLTTFFVFRVWYCNILLLFHAALYITFG